MQRTFNESKGLLISDYQAILEKQWNVEDMAIQTFLSPGYLQVLYRQTFGTTCISDVVSSRISLAKTLLTSTDFLVKEIALQSGYNQVYHFIRQFKKITGLTPGAYRKNTQ